MTYYRTLLLGVLSLFLAGCVGYDFDDDYGRSRGGYAAPYGSTYSGATYGYPSTYGGYNNGYSVQRYEVYSTPRYYRTPAPRYYAPPPPPRYYAPKPHRRPPVQQGWNQTPRGFYPAPGHDRHHSRDRDDHRGNDHRRDDRRGHDDWRQRNR